MSTTAVHIDTGLHERVQRFVNASGGFDTVEEYLHFVLETLFLPQEEQRSRDENELLSARLKALGYLD